MVTKTITITNKLGLHARPCSLIVSTANKFRSDFEIIKEGMKINGKSILGLMMLAATQGTILELLADGDDEQLLLKEISALFENNFGEE